MTICGRRRPCAPRWPSAVSAGCATDGTATDRTATDRTDRTPFVSGARDRSRSDAAVAVADGYPGREGALGRATGWR